VKKHEREARSKATEKAIDYIFATKLDDTLKEQIYKDRRQSLDNKENHHERHKDTYKKTRTSERSRDGKYSGSQTARDTLQSTFDAREARRLTLDNSPRPDQKKNLPPLRISPLRVDDGSCTARGYFHGNFG